jgi:tetratricopeptide (TPR) repeat protein
VDICRLLLVAPDPETRRKWIKGLTKPSTNDDTGGSGLDTLKNVDRRIPHAVIRSPNSPTSLPNSSSPVVIPPKPTMLQMLEEAAKLVSVQPLAQQVRHLNKALNKAIIYKRACSTFKEQLQIIVAHLFEPGTIIPLSQVIAASESAQSQASTRSRPKNLHDELMQVLRVLVIFVEQFSNPVLIVALLLSCESSRPLELFASLNKQLFALAYNLLAVIGKTPSSVSNSVHAHHLQPPTVDWLNRCCTFEIDATFSEAQANLAAFVEDSNDDDSNQFITTFCRSFLESPGTTGNHSSSSASPAPPVTSALTTEDKSTMRKTVEVLKDSPLSAGERRLSQAAVVETVCAPSTVIDNAWVRAFWNQQFGCDKEFAPLQTVLNAMLAYAHINTDAETSTQSQIVSMELLANLSAILLAYIDDSNDDNDGGRVVSVVHLQMLSRMVPSKMSLLEGLHLVLKVSTSEDGCFHNRVCLPPAVSQHIVSSVPVISAGFELKTGGISTGMLSGLPSVSTYCDTLIDKLSLDQASDSNASWFVFADSGCAVRRTALLQKLQGQIGPQRNIFWIDLRACMHTTSTSIEQVVMPTLTQQSSSPIGTTMSGERRPSFTPKAIKKANNLNSVSIALSTFLAQVGIQYVHCHPDEYLLAVQEFLRGLPSNTLLVLDNFSDCAGCKKLLSVLIDDKDSRGDSTSKNITVLCLLAPSTTVDQLRDAKVKSQQVLAKVLDGTEDTKGFDISVQESLILAVKLLEYRYPHRYAENGVGEQEVTWLQTVLSSVPNRTKDSLYRCVLCLTAQPCIPVVIGSVSNGAVAGESGWDTALRLAVDGDMRLCMQALIPLFPRTSAAVEAQHGIVFDEELAWHLCDPVLASSQRRRTQAWTKLIEIGWLNSEFHSSGGKRCYSIHIQTGKFEAEEVFNSEQAALETVVRAQWERYYLYWTNELVGTINVGLSAVPLGRKAAMLLFARHRHHFVNLLNLFLHCNPVVTVPLAQSDGIIISVPGISTQCLHELATVLSTYKMRLVYLHCLHKTQSVELAKSLVTVLKNEQVDGDGKSEQALIANLRSWNAMLLLADLCVSNDEKLDLCEEVLGEIKDPIQLLYAQRNDNDNSKYSADTWSNVMLVYAYYLQIQGTYHLLVGNNNDAAIDCLWRCTELRVQQLGRASLETVDAMQGWAKAVCAMQQFDKAKPMLIQIISIRSQTIGGTCVEVAELQQLLGDVLSAHYQALVGGSESARTIDTAATDKSKGYLEEAIDAYESALAIRRGLHIGEAHSSIASILNSLGHVYYALEKLDEAYEAYQGTLITLTELLGQGHVLLAPVHSSLGNVHYSRNEFDKAKPHYETALANLTLHRGDEDLEVADAVNRLAKLYLALDRPAVAKPLFERVVKLRKQSLGDSHPKTLSAMLDLDLATTAVANSSPQKRNSKMLSFLSIPGITRSNSGSNLDSNGTPTGSRSNSTSGAADKTSPVPTAVRPGSTRPQSRRSIFSMFSGSTDETLTGTATVVASSDAAVIQPPTTDTAAASEGESGERRDPLAATSTESASSPSAVGSAPATQSRAPLVRRQSVMNVFFRSTSAPQAAQGAQGAVADTNASNSGHGPSQLHADITEETATHSTASEVSNHPTLSPTVGGSTNHSGTKEDHAPVAMSLSPTTPSHVAAARRQSMFGKLFGFQQAPAVGTVVSPPETPVTRAAPESAGSDIAVLHVEKQGEPLETMTVDNHEAHFPSSEEAASATHELDPEPEPGLEQADTIEDEKTVVQREEYALEDNKSNDDSSSGASVSEEQQPDQPAIKIEDDLDDQFDAPITTNHHHTVDHSTPALHEIDADSSHNDRLYGSQLEHARNLYDYSGDEYDMDAIVGHAGAYGHHGVNHGGDRPESFGNIGSQTDNSHLNKIFFDGDDPNPSMHLETVTESVLIQPPEVSQAAVGAGKLEFLPVKPSHAAASHHSDREDYNCNTSTESVITSNYSPVRPHKAEEHQLDEELFNDDNSNSQHIRPGQETISHAPRGSEKVLGLVHDVALEDLSSKLTRLLL